MRHLLFIGFLGLFIPEASLASSVSSSYLVLDQQAKLRREEVREYKERYPLHHASKYKDITKTLEELKLENEDIEKHINAKDGKGRTPLHVSIFNKNKNAMYNNIEFLILHDADVDLKDNKGQTVLHYAAYHGVLGDIVLSLIRAGAEINATDNNGKNPLYYAYSWINEDHIIEILEERGATETP